MKAINVVYTLIGLVILGLLIWFVANQIQKNKEATANANKGVPTCVAECPDGKTVTYPCDSTPRCASTATNRIIVLNPTPAVDTTLIRNGGRNVGNTNV